MQLNGAQDGDCSAGTRGQLAANWEWGDGEEELLFSTAAALLHVKEQLSKCEARVCPGPWCVPEEPGDSPLLTHTGWQKTTLFWTQSPLRGRTAAGFETVFTDDV